MPTYSYRCRDCGVEFDIHQEFSDAALSECPQCSGSLRKLFSAVGVTFQGSGFYRTDSRAPETTSGAKTEKASSDKASTTPPAPSPSPSTSSQTSSGSSSSTTSAA